MHYSGTPGMKPNPRLLVDLARAFAGERQVRVVAISEGPGGRIPEGATEVRSRQSGAVIGNCLQQSPEP